MQASVRARILLGGAQWYCWLGDAFRISIRLLTSGAATIMLTVVRSTQPHTNIIHSFLLGFMIKSNHWKRVMGD